MDRMTKKNAVFRGKIGRIRRDFPEKSRNMLMIEMMPVALLWDSHKKNPLFRCDPPKPVGRLPEGSKKADVYIKRLLCRN